MKTLRLTLIALLALVLFTGCATQKRCLTKFPPVTSVEIRDSIVSHDTIIYRDRTVYDTIQGDTIVKEVEVPVYITKDLKTDPIEAENAYAYAKAWIENQRLKLELRLKEQAIERRLENAKKKLSAGGSSITVRYSKRHRPFTVPGRFIR